jgi:hypothetical protein
MNLTKDGSVTTLQIKKLKWFTYSNDFFISAS